LYCLYFWYSAYQISEGLPSFQKASSTLEYEDASRLSGILGNLFVNIYVSLPFAAELRCLLDFMMGHTALDMWQALQFYIYHSDFYLAKTANSSYNRKVLGVEEDHWFDKYFCGCFFTSLICFLLVGPFFLFSSMGATTMYNPISAAQYEFWLSVNETSFYTQGDFDIDSRTISWDDSEENTIGKQYIPFKIW